jgi:transglutaminase-like putative cysteine protease
MRKPAKPNLDWLSVCLLLLLIQIAAARLVTTNWAPFLYFVETLAALGTVLGLALGVSRFGRRSVAALAAAYTAFLLPWRLIGAVNDEGFLDRLRHVAQILLGALNQFLQRQPVKDPLLFVLFVCLAFWLISLAAGYWLARHGTIMWSVGFGGAAILVIQAYADYQPHGSWWLAIYLLTAILLAGRTHFLASKRDWSRRRVFISEESWPDSFSSLFLTAGIAVLAAWLIPTSPASLRAAADTWNTFSRPIRDRLANAVTSLNGPYGGPGVNFYGDSLALGQGAVSGDSTVFTVQVLRAPAQVLRYYWRGRVYDAYSNGRWSAAPASVLAFEPGQSSLTIPDEAGRAEVILRITSQFPAQGLIYAPAPAVWLDRLASVSEREVAPGLYDTLSWEAKDVVSKGATYEVRAEVANPGARQLRAAGSNYPSWVTGQYLGVPSGIQARLQALALEIGAGQDNAYDKAVAVTSYLRANLQYSVSVPAPPDGQDPVTWVLFDYKKGYCNYYASAEVLLLRSMGIPARLAVGFAQGESQGGIYSVRTRDAHAWPEVYFPSIGWMEFEPTAIQEPLLRPDEGPTQGTIPFVEPRERPFGRDQGPAPENAGSSASAGEVPFARTALGRALIILVALLAAAILAYLGNRKRWIRGLSATLSRTLAAGGVTPPDWIQAWARWNQMEAVERAFASVTWSLGWLGRPPPVDATPAERARALARLMPSASRHIEALQFELESGLFTPRPANLARAVRASFFVMLHSLHARFMRVVSLLDGRDVYSAHDQ